MHLDVQPGMETKEWSDSCEKGPRGSLGDVHLDIQPGMETNGCSDRWEGNQARQKSQEN